MHEVRKWPVADVRRAVSMSAVRGGADAVRLGEDIRLSPQTDVGMGHVICARNQRPHDRLRASIADFLRGSMRRGNFIALFGGAAIALPLRAHADQLGMPIIGLLGSSSSDPSAHWPFVVALRQGLADTGFGEGRNLAIESRWMPCGRGKWIAGRPDAGWAALRGSDADTAGAGHRGQRRLEVELGRAGQNVARACNFA